MHALLFAVLPLLVQNNTGWQPLFDGKTTAGWLEVTGAPFPSQSWTIEDGALRTKVVEGGFQDLRTAETFRDFEFEFEWKLEAGGNSGVKYLIEKVDRWDAKTGGGYNARGRGPEFQLIDDEVNEDSKGNPKKQTASLYGVLSPSKKLARPAGEWNTARIVVRAGHVEHWLNGEKVLEYEKAGRESPIVLQNHHSLIWFRALRVRRFE